MAANNYRMLGRLAQSISCLFVVLSFTATFLPLVVSASSSNTMPCCAGKSGHCDSGIAAKPPPQPREPMCGLHVTGTENDGITIVAEEFQNETHHASPSSSTGPAVESASVSQPCRMECGVCTASSIKQQKRDRAVAQADGRVVSPLVTALHQQDLRPFFSSTDEWPTIIPRGPPASSV
jgi:hypothetical protein